MSESGLWTPEQLAFQRMAADRRSQVHAIYREAIAFRLVRAEGQPVGWTFHTGNYPRSNFGWVSIEGRIGKADHEIRLSARKDLKKSTRKTSSGGKAS